MDTLNSINSHNKLYTSLVFVTLFMAAVPAFSQKLPLGYVEYYRHACNKTDLFNTLVPEYEDHWTIVADKPVNLLRITGDAENIITDTTWVNDTLWVLDTVPGVFPQSRGMMAPWVLGDYILKFDFKSIVQTPGDSSGFCFIAPARNSQTYYVYTFGADSIRFFYVKDSQMKKIDSQKAVKMNDGGWNTVIVTRDILARKISFRINNSEELISFSHPDLVMGYFGFGSHLATSYLKNMVLWAPTTIEETAFSW